MFSPPDTAKQDAAAFGLRLEDDEDEDGDRVYPENWPAFQVMSAMRTQWRTGEMGRPTGLDYTALPTVFSLLDIGKKRRPDVFDALRVMEAEALKTMNARNNG